MDLTHVILSAKYTHY